MNAPTSPSPPALVVGFRRAALLLPDGEVREVEHAEAVEALGVECLRDSVGSDPFLTGAFVVALTIRTVVGSSCVGDPGAVRRPDRRRLDTLDLIGLAAGEGDSGEPCRPRIVFVAPLRLEAQDTAVG